jgi:RimJ/RimL family protein N-acetyltransferase
MPRACVPETGRRATAADTTEVTINELGQPVGEAIPGWARRPLPTEGVLSGDYCRLERLRPDRHAEQLLEADLTDVTGASWTYLPYGPFADLETYRRWVEEVSASDDPLFYAVVDTDPIAGPVSSGRAVGVLSLLRIQPDVGSIEVGHVHFSPLLQRRRGATEAHYLLMRHAFDVLGYRRYEWKCDALNAPSRAAAARLGFRYEGTFRQATVVKGRNRDTAWYAILDRDWPLLRGEFQSWLARENFDDGGQQKEPLRRSG